MKLNEIMISESIFEYIIGTFCLLIGLGVLYFGFQNYNEQELKKKQYVKTTAIIYNLGLTYDEGSNAMYKPVYQYTVNDLNYKITVNYWTNIEPSKTTTVWYNSIDPSVAILKEGITGQIIFLMIGFVALMAGLVLILKNIPLTFIRTSGSYLISFAVITICSILYYLFANNLESYNPLLIFQINNIIVGAIYFSFILAVINIIYKMKQKI